MVVAEDSFITYPENTFLMTEAPRLAVDTIVRKDGELLLIRRGNPPFEGGLAFPGGMVEEGETVEEAALRELREETDISAHLDAILGVYSGPERDPRGHVVSVVFIGDWEGGEPRGGDDASGADWYRIEDLEALELAFDHGQILEDYMEWCETGQTGWSGR